MVSQSIEFQILGKNILATLYKTGHPSIQLTGSSTVMADGLPIARVGDNIACLSKNATGSSDVIAN